MLAQSMVYSSFSTHKLLETYTFYTDILGLKAKLVKGRFIHLYLPGGHTHVIYFKANHQASESTVLNFQVNDIAQIVDTLSAKGVTFLQLDAPFQTDSKGISWDDDGSHLAWFKDPGGNIIALIEN